MERRLNWYGHVMRREWRTHTEESVEGGYTREKEERTTENKMEIRMSTRFEKYWTESGRGDGQGDVEKKDHQLYRRPYMMGKARGKEERNNDWKFDMLMLLFLKIALSRRRLLIAFVSNNGGYLWQGVVYAVLLFLSKFVFSVLCHWWLQMSYEAAMNARSILNGIVYRKV